MRKNLVNSQKMTNFTIDKRNQLNNSKMIKKVVYKELKRSEAVKKCMAIATGYETMYDSYFIHNDMLISLDAYREWVEKSDRRCFYLAIREKGVESGTKEHVKERCDILGKPVCCIKLEEHGGLVDMYINSEIF